MRISFGLLDRLKYLSFGGYIGYAAQSYKGNYYGYNVDLSISYLILGPRMAYHFPLIPKADTYVGAMIGYGIATMSSNVSSYSGYSASGTGGAGGFAYSIHGGIRYPFSEHIGAFAEIGYGVSVLNLGLNAKF